MSDTKNVKINDIEHVVITSTMLSKLFGVTTARIRQLENEGVLKKISRGKYPLQENVKKYIDYLRINLDLKESKLEFKSENEDDEADYDKEHALLEKIKRKKAELELAAMKGEMHYGKDVERVMNDTLSNIKAKMQSIPSKLAPELIGIGDNIGEIEGIIEEAVSEALREASNYNPKDFYDGKYSENNE